MIVRALWLNGTVGVGKTTVGAEVANQLATAGDPVAFVDIDALGDLSPRPPDDPLNTRLVAKNLKSAHEELHAEKERIAGDPGLTPAGREQARLTAAAVAGFAVPVALYSNPLKRASETAAPSANRLALAIQYDDRLRERLN